MFALLYRSRAATRVDRAARAAISDHAGRRNALWGVTGALLCVPDGPGRGFAQWIEGDQETVEALYAHIRTNDLHTDCTVIASGTDLNAGTRRFSESDMVSVLVPRLPASVETFLSEFARGTEDASA